MKNYTIYELSEQLCELATINFDSSWQGDFVSANKAYAKSVPLKRFIVNNPQIAKDLTKYMLLSNNIYMARQGMIIAFSLGVNHELAKVELFKEIQYNNSSDKKLQKFGFEANMVKDSIFRFGSLLMYKGQKTYAVYEKNWLSASPD